MHSLEKYVPLANSVANIYYSFGEKSLEYRAKEYSYIDSP